MTRKEYAARAQRGLWRVVGILHSVEDVLAELVEGMPDSSPEMLEYRRPYDVMLEVEGEIRCVLGDDLRPMIARLKQAATVNRRNLVKHWEETKKKRLN